MRPYLEKAHHKKRTGGVAQGESPGFKLQYHKKNFSFSWVWWFTPVIAATWEV
jgi:hypothetical protein